MFALSRLDAPALFDSPSRRLVDLSQAGLSEREFDDELISLLNDLLGFDSAAILRSDRVNELQSWQMDPHVLELAQQAALLSRSRYAACMRPAIEETQRTGVSLDASLSPSDRRPESSPYLQEVLRPAGLRSMLQLCARWKGEPILRVHFHRSGMQRFGERERERLLRLMPVIESTVTLNRMEARAPLHLDRLTRREREVASCVARGLTNAEAAAVLGTSPYTVRNQVARIFDKLEIASRAELAAWAASMPEW